MKKLKRRPPRRRGIDYPGESDGNAKRKSVVDGDDENVKFRRKTMQPRPEHSQLHRLSLAPHNAARRPNLFSWRSATVRDIPAYIKRTKEALAKVHDASPPAVKRSCLTELSKP